DVQASRCQPRRAGRRSARAGFVMESGLLSSPAAGRFSCPRRSWTGTTTGAVKDSKACWLTSARGYQRAPTGSVHRRAELLTFVVLWLVTAVFPGGRNIRQKHRVHQASPSSLAGRIGQARHEDFTKIAGQAGEFGISQPQRGHSVARTVVDRVRRV